MPRQERQSVEARITRAPKTKVLDETYMHNTLRNIAYTKILLRRLAINYMTALRNQSDDRIIKQINDHRNLSRQELIDIRSCLSARIDQHLDYAVFGPRCQALCGQIYDKLPLEIRECIYDFLTPKSMLDVTDSYIKVLQRDTEEPFFPAEFFDMIGPKAYAHVFTDVFADPTVRIEMLRIWYRNTTFSFNSTGSLDLVEFFRFDRCASYDLCNTIRSIELAVPSPDDHYDNGTYVPYLDDTITRFKDRLFFLTKLAARAQITLSLSALQGHKQSRGVEMLCELFDAIELLLDYKMRLRVLVKPGWDFEVRKTGLKKECWTTNVTVLNAA